MTITNPTVAAESMNLDPTIPAPMTNVAEYGFEGRFEDWADDARYFEYSKAANPIGSGHAPQVPIARFGPELYLDQPTGVVPLDLSKELGITTARRPAPRCWPTSCASAPASRSTPARTPPASCITCCYGRGFAAVNGQLVQWEKGDFLTLPAGCPRGVLRRRRRGHVLGARRAAAALPGCRRDPAQVPAHQVPPRRRRRQARGDRLPSRCQREEPGQRAAGQRRPGTDPDHHPRAVGHVRRAAARARSSARTGTSRSPWI